MNKWFAVDPETIQINDFRFPNISDGSFATFLIKSKNGNKGIALLDRNPNLTFCIPISNYLEHKSNILYSDF